MLDGFIKGVLTSILGLAIMCLALYGWLWGDWFNDGHEAIMLGGIGFGLLFVREKLAILLIDFFKSKMGIKPDPSPPEAGPEQPKT